MVGMKAGLRFVDCDHLCYLVRMQSARPRSRNSFLSASLALSTLLGITLCITGTSYFWDTTRDFTGHFLAATLVAGLIGACFTSPRIWWGLTTGILTGLATALSILWWVASRI